MAIIVEHDTAEFPILPVTALPLTSGRVSVDIAGKSHPGLVRGFNEDHFLVARLRRQLETIMTNVPDRELPLTEPLDGYIIAVADGLGGHAAGGQASRLVIRKGLELILSSANWALRVNDTEATRLLGRMRDYFVEIDRSLLEAIHQDPILSGMATTLTVAYTTGLHAFVVHVGDSRVYRFSAGKLEQMTRDHTVAQSLAESGQIPAGEVRTHKKRNVLTNVISGRPGEVKPDVSAFSLQDGDVLLVCSDGLHHQVADATIAEVLAHCPNPADACETLIGHALRAGGRDNASVVVARYST